ncbi:MAG: cytochrome c [Planctomycetota bacterium]
MPLRVTRAAYPAAASHPLAVARTDRNIASGAGAVALHATAGRSSTPIRQAYALSQATCRSQPVAAKRTTMSTPRSMAHRFLLLSASLCCAVVLTQRAPAQRTGEEVFNSVCIACHTIGEGGRPGLGPDLKYVTYRIRDREWLAQFIRSSQSMIKAGDERAVTAFKHFGEVVMTDNVISDTEMDSLLAYLDAAHGLFGPGEDDGSGDPVEGQDIFQGRIRLANGGPACNSCHHVKNDAVIGGGILAKDLTQVFSRLGGQGVRAVLGNQPFPVMERAYKDNPLDPEEVASLVAFLRKADAEHELQQPKDYGIMLLLTGLGGCAVLFGLFALFWKGRKQRTVNATVYDRQLATM